MLTRPTVGGGLDSGGSTSPPFAPKASGCAPRLPDAEARPPTAGTRRRRALRALLRLRAALRATRWSASRKFFSKTRDAAGVAPPSHLGRWGEHVKARECARRRGV